MPDPLFSKPDRPQAPVSASLNATQVVANLAQLSGWQLAGDDTEIAIEKRFRFGDFSECLAFANALGWVVRRLAHPPALLLIEPDAGLLLLRWSSRSAGGLTLRDFEAARQTDALLPV